MSQPPRNRPPARRVSTGAEQSPAAKRNANVNVPARRDPFPFVMGGVIGALVVGLMLVLYLLASRSNNSSPQAVDNGNINPAQAGQATTVVNAQPGNSDP